MNVSTDSAKARAWAEINLSHLADNVRTVQRAHPDVRLLPMVKANAYGLGVGPVADVLEAFDPWGFGVATVEEGEELRTFGVARPIVVFTPARPDQFAAFRQHDLRPVLDYPDAIALWNAPFHLEVDTGMGRAGIRWDDATALEQAIGAGPEGVFTHFHSADVAPNSVTTQVKRFEAVVRRIDRGHCLVHAANSAGTWRIHDAYDIVRPGIFLYGGAVGADAPAPAPVVSVRARVVSVRRVRAGDSVSYGGDWLAAEPTTVATLGIGYADGIRRSVQGAGSVLLNGRRCRILGRVTMDMVMVDASGIPSVQPGDVATLIGSDGDDRITLDEMAEWAGTISYEVLTGLSGRLPRDHVR